MAIKKPITTLICILSTFFISTQTVFAHDGVTGYAYPLGKITVDGDLSDWPATATKYPIAFAGSDERPKSDADFSGFFQVGYRTEERSLYLAFTITDDDFIEDTTENVRWNTQDALELYLDARHLPVGSGVASFMYSKKLRNTNNNFYDAFAKDAKWNIADVVMVQKGTTRYYEWRFNLGNEFAVDKSIGFDFFAFDMDADKSFTFNSWGPGESKYVNSKSLCDILLLSANAQLVTINGKVAWDKKTDAKMPRTINLTNTSNSKLWIAASIDSNGNYSATIPDGSYTATISEAYIQQGEKLYGTAQKKPVIIVATKKAVTIPTITLSSNPSPDLIPEKGVLLNFTSANAKQVDNFIETYQKYYNIPGVSLALIKDGKVVYHKTYGVKNAFTKEPVLPNTLFEAASVTKPVFAFAVQRLAERGIIDLDKPLYTYLPYPDIEYDDRYKLITARHVLTHRTGFPNWRYMNPDNKLDLKFTPGTGYGYSGEGFEYLKMVIQTITGKNVEEVLQEEVIQPIGLWHTFFSRNDSLRKMVANGHFDGLPNYDELPEYPGMAYSMHTEATIFTKYMLYLLEQKGLSAKTYNEMFSKHSEYNWDPGEERPKEPTYMGESFEIRETKWGKTFGHGGNNGDFKCKFEVYKDLKAGYVLFTNSNTSNVLLESIRNFLIEGKKK